MLRELRELKLSMSRNADSLGRLEKRLRAALHPGGIA